MSSLTMSDTLTRRFRAQLTVAMDAVLRKTVMDIVRIFESSVCDYRKELSLKEDRLVELVRKLARTELQLTKSEGQNTSVGNKVTQNGRVQASDVAVQTSDDAFGDSRNLLDSCISVECQASVNPQEEMTPHVKVPRLSCQQMSTQTKVEPEVAEIDSEQSSTAGNKSDAGSSSVKKLNKTKPAKQTPQVKSNLIIYLKDIKDECTGLVQPQRPTKSPKEKPPVETKPAPNSNATQFVLKKQVTAEEEFGRCRSHKKACRACMKQFRDPAVYKRHLKSCRKLKRMLKPTKPGPEVRQLRSSGPLCEDKQKYPMVLENVFTCHVCHKKFDSYRSIGIHARSHTQDNDVTQSWTEPLEVDDDAL